MGCTSCSAAGESHANRHADLPSVPPRSVTVIGLRLPGLRRGQGHDGGMTQDLPPRATDIFRHLSDLRFGTYEGARPWPDRVEVFRRAVSLLDPVVRRVLEEANAVFLRGSGTIHHRAGDDRDGGAYAHWELSWPEQRHPAARPGRRVEPVQVIAVFGRGHTHPHLRGAAAGMWPCQVTDAADAERQEPILQAIVECELHERIFQGTWQVIPAFTSQVANAAS